jgi:polysaccharide biosynthesis transport protein
MTDQRNLLAVSQPTGGGLADGMACETRLLGHLRVLRKHKWLIALFVLTLVAFVSIATFHARPTYDATARIEIDPENTVLPAFAGGSTYESYANLETYIETQAQLLMSQTLAMLTIKSLQLEKDPRFNAHPESWLKLVVVMTGGLPGRRPPVLETFLRNLSVKRVPNSRLLDVTYSAPDPKLAASIVNTHVENFIDQNLRRRYQATMQASLWLPVQIDKLKSEVETSEVALINYERTNQIWTIDQKQNTVTQKLADLNQQLTVAQADRISKEPIFNLVQNGNLDIIPAIRNSSAIRAIQQQRQTLESQLSAALSRYGPEFPLVLRLQGQIRDLDQSLALEERNLGNQVEADYRAARRRELILQQALKQKRQQAVEIADKMAQYNSLRREAEVDKELYDNLLQKQKGRDNNIYLPLNNIHVVDAASVPPSPSRPQKAVTISLAAMIGLVGGIGLAYLRERMNNRLKTPHDIEVLSRLPILAVVPESARLADHKSGKSTKFQETLKATGNGGRLELMPRADPQSQISDAFRALRTSLLLSQADRPPQVILVTSALPGEGKTSAAVNLAVTLAQLGDKTLLVDGDLRRPGVSRDLNMAGGRYAGLSSFLAGVSTLDLVAVPHPTIGNLAVMPTGPVPPNPGALFSSRRLRDMIAELRKRYRFIIIDAPAVTASKDALIVSLQADGVVLVVRSRETRKKAFTHTHDLLSGIRVPIIGVVLNGVDDADIADHSYGYCPYDDNTYGPKNRRHDDHQDTPDQSNGSRILEIHI